MYKIRVLNGPNLNLLGTREPKVYGHTTLKDIEDKMRAQAESYGWEIDFIQSNHEGALTDAIHEAAAQGYKAVIMNPGAFTHYSYALRDAISGTGITAIEVHISNIHAREPFREKSVIAPVCMGQICGLGLEGYLAALFVLKAKL